MSEVRLEIKRVQVNEIPKLAEVANEIWHEYFIPIIGEKQVEYMVEKFQSVKGITEQSEKGYEYYFALYDDEIVGYFGIQPQEEKLFLSKLYLKKRFRGKGIATKLFSYIVDIAKSYDKKLIYLTVNKHNDNTISVYKHMGFKIVSEQKADIGKGFYMDDYIMEYNF